MKNYFYSTQIAKRIKELLDANLTQDEAKNISIGSLNLLPPPDKLELYLPAVIITTGSVETVGTRKVTSAVYPFTIQYVYPFRFREFEDTAQESTLTTEKIANILIHYSTLNDMTIEKTETESGGVVRNVSVPIIAHETADTEIFAMGEIPAAVGTIDFNVEFINYS